MILATPVSTNPESLNLKHDKPYVVLMGLDCLQGLQTARIFANLKIPVIGVISNREQYFGHTRVCEAILQLPPHEQGGIELLQSLGKHLQQKAVLIPCTDSRVTLISKEREHLKEWYHIALPEHDVVDLLMDKIRLYQFAEEHNLRIPKTYLLHNRDDALRILKEISFPAVIKPPSRPALWRDNTKEKAFKVDDEKSFMACYDKYSPFIDVLIAQQWIYGDDKSLYSCNCYYNKNGECLVTFTARKIRQYPPRTGQSSLGEEVRADVVLEETVRLFDSVKYHGLGYLEMKQDIRTSEYYIVEPNIGRPTGRSAIAEAGGVDILYTMYCDLVGLPLPDTRNQSYGNVKWIHLLRDLKSAYFYWRQNELTLTEWFNSMQGRKYYAVLSLRDPRPFISALMASLNSNKKV